jgi:multiple sugar transport system ATP-binding protein
MGVRPEYFEDASLVEEHKRHLGSTFTARVDVTEWLGDSQFAYIPFDAPAAVTKQLQDLSRELDSDQLRTQAIVSIDATSRMREGRDAEFWIDTRKIHCFDPASGDNLTRDAEAGAALTREAVEDRESDLARNAQDGDGDGRAPASRTQAAPSHATSSTEAGGGSRRL